MTKKIISMTMAVAIAATLAASCGSNNTATDSTIDAETLAAMKVNPELVKNKTEATIVLEDGREIELELYPDLAPDTVENFVTLAEEGFYDGTIFHRVIEDFMIQGGGYDENLRKMTAKSIKGEFAANGYENTLSHIRGIISMARAQDVNSATSQFFIVQQDADYLDGQYAAFGRVTDGMDVVDEIASVRTGSVPSQGMEDVPVDPIVIDTIVIHGADSSSSAKSSSSSRKSSSGSPSSSSLPFVSGGDYDSGSGSGSSYSGSYGSGSGNSYSGGYGSSSGSPLSGIDDDEPIARGNLS